MKIFIRHFFLYMVPLVKKEEFKFSYDKEPEKLWSGDQSCGLPRWKSQVCTPTRLFFFFFFFFFSPFFFLSSFLLLLIAFPLIHFLLLSTFLLFILLRVKVLHFCV